MAPAERDPILEARSQWVRHGWGAAADGMALVTAVVRVQQLYLERIDAVLRPLGLSFARYEVLVLLSFSATGAMRMNRMGSLLQVHPTSVSSAVARLEAQGFVTRTRADADRRVVRAAITDAGADVARRATEALNREVFEHPGVEGDDLQQLTRLLATLRGAPDDL